MIYAIYIVLAAAVVFSSIKLAKYVDLLEKTTSVSGAFIGGILLAAVTSLPELITSISAILFINQNGLVLGNILGSNHFNLAMLGGVLVFFGVGFAKSKLTKFHLVNLSAMLILYGLTALAVLAGLPTFGWFHWISFIILAVYVFVVVKTPKEEEKTETIDCNITKKQLIFRFVIAAVLLVASSVAVTYASDIIATRLNLGRTFAGALLLGVATSLPEFTSTITLCRRKNIDSALSNVFGSNVFNFMILALGDFLSFRQGNTLIYLNDLQSRLLLILGVCCCVLFIFLLTYKRLSKKTYDKEILIASESVSVLTAASYVLFIVLSFVLI